jgi:hypothetical protein
VKRKAALRIIAAFSPQLLRRLRPGDIVTVSAFDRLTRGGRFKMRSVLAEITSRGGFRRTAAGRERARLRGVKFGAAQALAGATKSGASPPPIRRAPEVNSGLFQGQLDDDIQVQAESVKKRLLRGFRVKPQAMPRPGQWRWPAHCAVTAARHGRLAARITFDVTTGRSCPARITRLSSRGFRIGRACIP